MNCHVAYSHVLNVRNFEQPEIRLGGLDSIRVLLTCVQRKVCENLPLKRENAKAVNAVRHCNIPSYDIIDIMASH